MYTYMYAHGLLVRTLYMSAMTSFPATDLRLVVKEAQHVGRAYTYLYKCVMHLYKCVMYTREHRRPTLHIMSQVKPYCLQCLVFM